MGPPVQSGIKSSGAATGRAARGLPGRGLSGRRQGRPTCICRSHSPASVLGTSAARKQSVPGLSSATSGGGGGDHLPATPALPQGRAAVQTSLGSQTVYRRPGSLRATVPLLLPEQDGLPFGLALEMIQWTDEEAIGGSRDISTPGTAGEDPAYNLHFVMCGEGAVKCAQGVSQPLTAGDSILGASRLPAGPVSLVASEGSASVAGWDLVVLRVVFPTDLKLGSISELQPTDTVKAAAADWCQGEVQGPVGESLARDLLAGVQEAARAGLDAAEAREMSRQSAAAAAAGVAGAGGRLLNLSDRLHEGLTRHNVALVKLFDSVNATVGAALPGSNWQMGGLPQSALQRRPLMEADTFRLPNQTNLLALVFDPLGEEQLPFTFGVEVFQCGHVTPPHVHRSAYELFFILSGTGVGFCNGDRFKAKAGDTIVFPPGSVHGIDNGPDGKMYLLELMVPNDAFAEFVRQGQLTGLEDEDLCVLIGQGCGIVPHTLNHGDGLYSPGAGPPGPPTA